ncbi:MAG: DUF6177 family protein [bacterium]|nr:DUF6177 family protein [bacterium]
MARTDTVPRILPAIDERTDRYVAFMSPRRLVELTPGLALFLATAEVDGRVPILVTSEDSEVSGLLAMEMARSGGRWAVRRRDGVVVDALANRELSSLDDLLDAKLLAARPHADLAGPDDTEGTAVIGLEVLAHHRPLAEIEMGRVLEDTCDLLGLARPDVFGVTEPLTQVWDRRRLTALARHEMPSSSRFRVGAPGDAWFTLKYDRGPTGVVERLRGWVPVGTWEEAEPRVVDTAERLLEGLHRGTTMIAGIVSLMDMDSRGRQGVRRRHMELPRAIYLGPWALRETSADRELLVREFGARELRGTRESSLLFRFDGPPKEIVLQLARGISAVGVPEMLAAFGLGDGNGR